MTCTTHFICDCKQAEFDRLKDALSYLPKFPTEPYEKELAKRIFELEAENKRLRDIIMGDV